MRVLIVSDMEGISGITLWAQVANKKNPELHQEGRQLYTLDINAAVNGAVNAGAGTIVLCEFHGPPEPFRYNNVIPDMPTAALKFITTSGPLCVNLCAVFTGRDGGANLPGR